MSLHLYIEKYASITYKKHQQRVADKSAGKGSPK
jgi:hypothetical protein